MHIDAHQHFWRYERREYGWIDDSMAVLRRDFLPADLKPELDRSGFQGCIAVQARETLEETRWLLELAERAPFIFGVVGWVDLRSPRLPLELKSFGFRISRVPLVGSYNVRSRSMRPFPERWNQVR